jgi:hypothetical protein
MEQLAVLTSTRRAIVIGDQVAAACPRPANRIASAARETSPGKCPATPELATEISHAADFNSLFNGAGAEIAGEVADYAGDVLRQ